MSRFDVTLPKPVIEQCVACKQFHRVGELMCPHCNFITSTIGKTRKVGNAGASLEEKSWSRQIQNFTDTTVMLEIDGRQIRLPVTPYLIVGRTTDVYCPDIDLTPFGGDEKGVSRQHLRISRDALIYVADMGSTNGTYLNGQRLFYNSDCPLTDGDILGIGQIQARVQFIHP